MTCREKIAATNPDAISDEYIGGVEGCPSEHGLLNAPDVCDSSEECCRTCWDREIPENWDDCFAEDLYKTRKLGEMFGMYACDLEIPKKLKPKVVCISGKAQHGKDTSATILKDLLEVDGKKVLITHYGDLVKYICKTFFGWDGNKDETGRAILQRVGTDEVRAQRPNYWVDFVVGILQMFPNEWDYILIPDTRFPNEIDSLKEVGFDVTHVRIIRAPFISPLTPEQQMHISETALDGVRADIYILNSGSVGDLVGELQSRVVSVVEKGVKTNEPKDTNI